MAKLLLIIAPDQFRDEELFVTRDVLEKSGHETVVASTRTGRISGAKGGFEDIDVLLKTVVLDDFEGIIFVGGAGAQVFFDDVEIMEMARRMEQQGKVVAAICIAPVILANAGLLAGKKATVFASEVENIKKGGALYTGEDVVADSNIITANGPQSAEAFARQIMAKL